MEEINESMIFMQNFGKKFSEQEQQLKEAEKRNLELVSDIEKRRKKSSEQKSQLNFFQGIIENLQDTNANLQSKLDETIIKHQVELEQVKKEKNDLKSELEDSENSKEECQETLDKLQIQLERRVTKCSKLRNDLSESQKTIDGQEEMLVEAERIIRDQQKAIQETEDKLKKTQKCNAKIEIDRLERCLSQETQEKTNVQVKYKRLREFVFSLNAEFSVVTEDLSTSQQSGGDGEKEDDNSAQVKLEVLSTRVKNKLIAWAENQKMVKDELRETQQVVILLSQLLNQCLGQKLEANKDVTDSTSFLVAGKNTTVKSCRDIARQSTLPNVSKSPSAFVFNSLNYIECPRLSLSSSSGGKRPVQAILSKRHRLFPKKRRLWKCHNVVVSAIKGRCIQCGKPFASWEKLYHHKRTVHVIQKSKKVLQQQGRSQAQSWKKEKNPPHPSPKTKTNLSFEAPTITSPEPINTGDDNEDQQQRCPITFSDVVVEVTSTPNATPEFTILKIPKSGQNDSTTSGEPTISGTNTSQTSNIFDPLENFDTIVDGRKSHGVDLSKRFIGFYCICGQRLTTKANLTMHIEYFTKEWKFLCEMCDQRFLYLCHLKKHYADSHKMPKYLKQFLVGCCECGTMFTTRTELNLHRRNVHQPLLFKTHAKTSFQNEPKSMAKSNGRHLQMMSQLPRKLSPIRSIPTPASAVKMKPVKDPPSHRLDRSKQKSGFFCKCGHQTLNKAALQKHISCYSTPKQFSCLICGCMFKFTSGIRKHMQKVHDMTFEVTGCGQCGQLFHNIEELNEHKSNEHPRKKRKRKAEEIDLTNNVRIDDDEPSASPHPVKKAIMQRTNRNQISPAEETILTPLPPGTNPFPSQKAHPAPLFRGTDPSALSLDTNPTTSPRDNSPPKHPRETDPRQPSREIDPPHLIFSSAPGSTAAQILLCHSSKEIQSLMTMTSCDLTNESAETKTLNLHGIDVNRYRDEYFCKCGTQFPDSFALETHILNHVCYYESTTNTTVRQRPSQQQRQPSVVYRQLAGTSLSIAPEPIGTRGHQNMISVNGNQCMISTDGLQNTISANDNQSMISANDNQSMISANDNQSMISANDNQSMISANDNQSMISAYGHQNTIRPHGHQNIIRSNSYKDTGYQSGLWSHRQQSIVRSHRHSNTNNTSHHETSVDLSWGPENGIHATQRPDVHQGTATTTTSGLDECSPVAGLRRMSSEIAPQSDQTTPLPPVRPSVAGQTGTSLPNSALPPAQPHFSFPVYHYNYYCSTSQFQ